MPDGDCLNRQASSIARPSLLFGLIAMLLTLPRFNFAYLYDDYDFLGRTRLFHLSLLAPDRALMYYRPISREIFFALLNAVSPASPLVGHIANALLLGSAVALGARLSARLAGRRAGIISGLLLATFSQFPVLVAWG